MKIGKIDNSVVTFYPDTGEVLRQNPMPERALEERVRDPKSAASAAGLGRVKWSVVESYTRKDVFDFKHRYELGDLLVTNAKTIKPRPSGRHGEICGLALSPHFYPNLLHEINLDKDGHLARFDKRWFNSFDPSTPQTAAAHARVPAKDLINFCTGASQFCRQTCLVLTGQNPNTREASRAKLKHSYALLDEPELFVALLNQQLQTFVARAQANDLDAVVRLNMLSDLPWYAICPELLLAFEGQVAWYDYTKVPFWRSADYRRLPEGLLDLTFSFSGSNDSLCAEALKEGVRIAVVFAPADAGRRATVAKRTSWTEILESGIVDEGDDGPEIGLFGGRWPIVDGDESDYRIDDPAPSIVALNFKEPSTKDVPEARTRESRARFAVAVPDEEGLGSRFADVRARKKFWKAEGIEPEELGVRGAVEYEAGARARENPDDSDGPVVDESLNPISDGVGIAMAPIKGTNLLIGPHVPTVLND